MPKLMIAFLLAVGLTVVCQCVGLVSAEQSWLFCTVSTVTNLWLLSGDDEQ